MSKDASRGDSHVPPACIRDIFLHSREKHRDNFEKKFTISRQEHETNCLEYLNVYPNMTEIRPINTVQFGNSGGNGGKKRKITEFSKKSRRNFIKFLCKLDEPVEFWQDFTFADDVMTDKTIEQRTKTSNDALNRFRRTLIDKYPTLWAVYKREWVPRKSGALIGEYIPHFHMFISERNKSDQHDYGSLALDLARIWVHCMQTSEYGKAIQVAQNSRSYRLIKSQRQAMAYASKYVSKENGFKTNESIGRSWGTLGDVITGSPEIIEVTPDEAVKIKRILRRKVSKKSKALRDSLKRPNTPTFVIIHDEWMIRIIKHVDDRQEWECRANFSGVA